MSLSGGLSRALCYIHRHSARYAASPRHQAKPRILCLLSAGDTPLQYIPVMNCIFAAQHAGVVVDALVVGQADSALLQQAAHITGETVFSFSLCAIWLPMVGLDSGNLSAGGKADNGGREKSTMHLRSQSGSHLEVACPLLFWLPLVDSKWEFWESAELAMHPVAMLRVLLQEDCMCGRKCPRVCCSTC